MEIEIKVRGKDEESKSGSAMFSHARALMRPEIIPDLVFSLGDAKIGTLPKDKQTGKVVTEWNEA